MNVPGNEVGFGTEDSHELLWCENNGMMRSSTLQKKK